MPRISPIAAHVIEKCGGVEPVSKALGVHITRVYRFMYATDKGGTGGLIPAKHQGKLLTKFPQLKPGDFFERDRAVA